MTDQQDDRYTTLALHIMKTMGSAMAKTTYENSFNPGGKIRDEYREEKDVVRTTPVNNSSNNVCLLCRQ